MVKCKFAADLKEFKEMYFGKKSIEKQLSERENGIQNTPLMKQNNEHKMESLVQTQSQEQKCKLNELTQGVLKRND